SRLQNTALNASVSSRYRAVALFGVSCMRLPFVSPAQYYRPGGGVTPYCSICPNLFFAHCACSATIGSSSSDNFSSNLANLRLPLFPLATTAFRRSPVLFARRIGDPRNVF